MYYSVENSDSMSYPGSIYKKICKNKNCKAKFFQGFALKDDEIYPDVHRDKQKFFVSTNG